MKILLETTTNINGFVEEVINEEDGSVLRKKYFIEGIFSTPDVINRNNRLYSRDIWSENVERYNKEELELDTINTFGEWEHPPRSEVHKEKAVIKIRTLEMREDGVWGKAEVIDNDDNPNIVKLKEMIDSGKLIGVSSRGTGTVGNNGVILEFHLITYDVVDIPSDRNAMLNGIFEGFEIVDGVVQGKEVSIIDGCIGEECLIPLNEKQTEKSTLDILTEIKYLREEFNSLKKVNENLIAIINPKKEEKEKKYDVEMKKFIEVLNNKYT